MCRSPLFFCGTTIKEIAGKGMVSLADTIVTRTSHLVIVDGTEISGEEARRKYG